jgi:hypothetical protein
MHEIRVGNESPAPINMGPASTTARRLDRGRVWRCVEMLLGRREECELNGYGAETAETAS